MDEDEETDFKKTKEFKKVINEMNISGNQDDLKERIKGNKIQLSINIKMYIFGLNNTNILGHALQEKTDTYEKDKKIESKTVARTLLEDAINGHKLILKELDEYLVEGPIKSEEEKNQADAKDVAPTNLNAKDYHIIIDLRGILPEKGKPGLEGKEIKQGILPEEGETGPERKEVKQCQVLFDILDVGVDADIIEDIVKHPVITTMILKKWEKTKYFYWLTAFMYMLFLISYSFLIYDLFGDKYADEYDPEGKYYKSVCPNATERYAEEIKNLTACQFRDPICNVGKYSHI